MLKSFFSLGALLHLACLPATQAILPTAAIDIHCTDHESCDTTLLASQATFGVWPAMTAEHNEPMIPTVPPSDDPLLCIGSSSMTDFIVPAGSKYVLVVPRGLCTFQQKAMNAQKLGASGIIIYGTLASRFSLNSTQIAMNNNAVTSASVVYPQQFYDYDCDKASAEIPLMYLSLNNNLPYDAMHNDPILSGSAEQGNVCAQLNTDFVKKCPSERCLLTGESDDLGQNMMACCAWDLHVWLYKDDNVTAEVTSSINIPAFYITMAEADELALKMQTRQITITMYRRYYPSYNISSVVIWALGVFVAALAAWMSASEYRNAKIVTQDNPEEMQPMDSSTSSSRSNSRGEEQDAAPIRDRQEESLELTAAHACGFIIFSTSGLLILFFFKIYNVVKIFYAFGCGGAIFQIIFYPLFHRISTRMGVRDRIAFTTDTLELGAVSYAQIMAAFVSYGLCSIWIYIAFTHNHPDGIFFFWVMQDIMGGCMCIIFLSTMKLNSIKVAAVLLTAAFFYDIFFVFVTPFLTKGGKSIMVDVATSGGPPKADPAWCEKYPDDANCQGGDPLPMLFTIPRLFDYSGGSSLLGLGDIVLPGLLLSFGARYDAAKRMIGKSSRDGRIAPQNCQGQKRAYFPALVVAYAIGLAMANIAVYAMQMGQPALLYLVPCCLGTMSYLGWRRGELSELWNTPKVLASCDKILYGPIVEELGLDEAESPNLRPIT